MRFSQKRGHTDKERKQSQHEDFHLTFFLLLRSFESSWMTLKESRLLLRCLFHSGNADIYSRWLDITKQDRTDRQESLETVKAKEKRQGGKSSESNS